MFFVFVIQKLRSRLLISGSAVVTRIHPEKRTLQRQIHIYFHFLMSAQSIFLPRVNVNQAKRRKEMALNQQLFLFIHVTT